MGSALTACLIHLLGCPLAAYLTRLSRTVAKNIDDSRTSCLLCSYLQWLFHALIGARGIWGKILDFLCAGLLFESLLENFPSLGS